MSQRRQPQRLPPPITHGGEPLEGELVLREFPDELGLLLWKTARAVRLWAELGETERPHAFEEGAFERRMERLEAIAKEHPLRPSLIKAAGVLHGKRVRARSLAAACSAIADWAAEQGALGSALEFDQAAALALPRDAGLARQVALRARARSEHARAETWFRQGIARARCTHDWTEFARCYGGLGKVFLHRGAFPQARKALIRALRAARRHGLRAIQASVYHELAVLAIQTDRPAEVTRYARGALATYPPGHPRLPWLAHDLGAFLIRRGYFAEALPIVASVPASCGRPTDRLVRAACLARAAAALGDRSLYRSAGGEVEALLSDPGAAEAAVNARIFLARAAGDAGDLPRALRLAEEARHLATQREEAEAIFDAEALVTALQQGTAPETAARRAPAPVRALSEAFSSALAVAGPA